MSKTVVLLLVLFLAASCLIAVKPAFSSEGDAENTWTAKAPMPTARCSLGVAVVNGKIYAIGGHRDPSYALVGINEMYDPESNTWTKLASMPTPRAEFGIAVYQNKIYVIGGVIGIRPYFRDGVMSVSIMTGANEVYDPATNTWENRSPMPTKRGVMQANIVGDKIYVSGGSAQDSGFSNNTEAYDPASDSWTTMASMPIFQGEFSSAAVDGNIFFISDKVQIFNPKNNHWTTGTSPPNAVFQGAAVATTGIMAPKRIYVLDGGSGLNQVYDPDNDSWAMAASMPNEGFNRLNLAVAISNDTLYAIGGSNTENPGTFDLLTLNDQYTPIGYGTLPEPTPTPLPALKVEAAVAVSLMIAVVVGAGLLVYNKKRKRVTV